MGKICEFVTAHFFFLNHGAKFPKSPCYRSYRDCLKTIFTPKLSSNLRFSLMGEGGSVRASVP